MAYIVMANVVMAYIVMVVRAVPGPDRVAPLVRVARLGVIAREHEAAVDEQRVDRIEGRTALPSRHEAHLV